MDRQIRPYRLSEPSYETMRESRKEFMREVWEPSRVAPPPTLFHYCSAEAFVKIIESKTLLLSPLCSLNDYMENQWLRKQTELEIESRIAGKTTIPSKGRAVMKAYYDAVRNRMTRPPRDVPYVACFSEAADDLGQWITYADAGKGFAIGFKASRMSYPKSWTDLRRVSYDTAEHRKIVGSLLDFSKSNLAYNSTSNLVEFCAGLFEISLSVPAAHCKNEKFQREQEWRIVFDSMVFGIEKDYKRLELPPVCETGFRTKDGEVIHYLKIPFRKPEKWAISSIVLGPKNPALANRYSLDLLLRKHGFERTKIAESTATYR